MSDVLRSEDKLAGLPPIRFINLDRSVERRRALEAQFAHWGITDFKRIRGIDGRAGEVPKHLDGQLPEDRHITGAACSLSHLNAIRDWLETSDTSELMVMEDDCVLDAIAQWPFSWQRFRTAVPADADAIQLSVFSNYRVSYVLHPRGEADFSSCCYVVSRPYAEKLIRIHASGKKFRLDMYEEGRSTSEFMLFDSGKTYTFPLVRPHHDYVSDITGSIQPRHHIRSGMLFDQFWTEIAPTVRDWDEVLTAYPPFGRRWSRLDWRKHCGMVNRNRFPWLPISIWNPKPKA